MSWMRRSNEDEFGWDHQRWERGKATRADFVDLTASAGHELQITQDPARQARCVQVLAFVLEHGHDEEQAWAHKELVGHVRQSQPLDDDAAAGKRQLPEPARHALDVVNRPEEGRELDLTGVSWFGLDLQGLDLSGATERQRHGIGIVDLRSLGFGEPACEQGEGIVGHRRQP